MASPVFRLAECDPVIFIPIVNVQKAKDFYGGKLGLNLLREDLPFALVYDANGILLRLAVTPGHTPQPGTVAGWRVREVAVSVTFLRSNGIATERFSFLEQDDFGIWSAPSGARIAWFKDPDGNLLSLSEHPELNT